MSTEFIVAVHLAIVPGTDKISSCSTPGEAKNN